MPWRHIFVWSVLVLCVGVSQTAEAQERVGTDIAVQVRDFLKGGIIQHAVNFFSLSGDVYDQVKPAIDMGERLGLFLGQVCPGSFERIEIGLYGDFRDLDVKPILAAAVAGALRPAVPAITLVNSRSVAEERGLEVLESTAEAMINSRPLGAVVPMSEEAIGELTRAFAGAG